MNASAAARRYLFVLDGHMARMAKEAVMKWRYVGLLWCGVVGLVLVSVLGGVQFG